MVSRRTTTLLGFVAFAGICAGIVVGAVLWLRPDHRMRIYAAFDSAPELHIGAPVRLGGVRIGSVESAIPQPGPACGWVNEPKPAGGHLLAALRIDADYTHLVRINSTLHVTTVSPLGELYVEIDADGTGRPINVEDRLCGQAGISAADLMDESGRIGAIGKEMAQAVDNYLEIPRAFAVDVDRLLCENGILCLPGEWIGLPSFSGIGPAIQGADIAWRHILFDTIDVGRSLTNLKTFLKKWPARVRQWSNESSSIASGPFADLQRTAAEIGGQIENSRTAALPSLENIQQSQRFIASRISDKRYTLGAFSADLEMQNDVKGLQRDLKRYLTRFLLSGGDKSIPAR